MRAYVPTTRNYGSSGIVPHATASSFVLVSTTPDSISSILAEKLMHTHIIRSIHEQCRAGLTWVQSWKDYDRGLILCWEKGRELRKIQPALADRAQRGELVLLPWKGGVEWKLADDKKGSLEYLAMWQGLRGEDLHVPLTEDTCRTCSRTGQVVFFAKDNFLSTSNRKRAPRP